tara:strand:- start:285 stop:791 length:507 start_codon:yes stop_codon:yes gene_type:complete
MTDQHPFEMSPDLADAYGKAKEIKRMERGNPRLANLSSKEQVKTLLRKKGETGSPKPVDDATKKKNDQAVKDLMESLGTFKLANPKARKLPKIEGDTSIKTKGMETIEGGNPNEYGGPKEDLEEVAGQLSKASKLHGNQSKRVASIAKGMKGEVGNPYMKRGKSKYGM